MVQKAFNGFKSQISHRRADCRATDLVGGLSFLRKALLSFTHQKFCRCKQRVTFFRSDIRPNW
jgi:hypothetical protein